MGIYEKNSLKEVIKSFLSFTPLESQEHLMDALENFISSPQNNKVFILNGYAGTGKTSIMGALVKALDSLKIKNILLAPTGRAAKVFSSFAGKKAYTIHKRILREDALDPYAGFFTAPNKDKNTLFLVDESSMISDDPISGNSLLEQLVSHVYSSPGCRMILIGDKAQLPPVGQNDSPAMNPQRLTALGLEPSGFTLKEPVRQVKKSGILYNATLLRHMITGAIQGDRPLRVTPFKDVTIVEPAELEDYLTSSWSKVGMNETILITRSNWRANGINHDIRGRILYAEEELMRDEQLIVTKNNYFWKFPGKNNADFIANGEGMTVKWFGNPEKKFGKRFIDTELLFPNSDHLLSAKIILDSLSCEGPNLSREETYSLYQEVMNSYPGTRIQKSLALRKDPYFNALQIKYSYCVTCHKAQGGQWKHVYIDLAGINPENMGEDYYRWLYTAITRASEQLYLVNPSVATI